MSSHTGTLALPLPHRPVPTAWGPAHDAEVLADGIVLYSTATHGGIALSSDRVQAMPSTLRPYLGQCDAYGIAWLEEDIDWSIAALAFPEAFSEAQRSAAEETLRNWRPAAWESFHGRTLTEDESQAKRSAAFYRRHSEDLIVIAGYGSWAPWVPKGKVGVLATRGAVRNAGAGGDSYWLVDDAEYTNSFSEPGFVAFVIDPARHQRVASPAVDGAGRQPANDWTALRRDWIKLAGASAVVDEKGLTHGITEIRIRAEGAIPDVYVSFEWDVGDHALYDDRKVIGHVMTILAGLGYSGKPFDRAELGMQSSRSIVLEPGQDFRRFAIERFGWRDISG